MTHTYLYQQLTPYLTLHWMYVLTPLTTGCVVSVPLVQVILAEADLCQWLSRQHPTYMYIQYWIVEEAY